MAAPARSSGPGGTLTGAAPGLTARPRRTVLLPALASGALLAAATPPTPSAILPFVALVPLAVALAALPPGTRGGNEAVLAGMITGAVQHAWGLRWLPGTLGAVAGPATGWVGFVAVITVLGSLTGSAAWALHRVLARPRPVPLAIGLGLAWAALEWTLAHLPFGLAFPWAPLGLGLARWPATLGLAELLGVVGVTAWLAAVNGALAAAVLRARATRGLRPALARVALASVMALIPIVWGVERARTLDLAVSGRVAALTLDVAPTGSPAARARAALSALEAALGGIGGPVDVIALPEMVVPLDLAARAGEPVLTRLRASAAAAPVLVGTLGVAGERELNSAVLVREEGLTDFRADKRRLVPGVERASAVTAPWLAPRREGGYAAGAGWPVASVGALRMGVLLCYEVAFSGDARELVRAGANALVALTSDAWFAGGAGARAAGVAQHLAHLTLRVIETRTGGARSSNGGPAALIAPAGLEQARAEPGVAVGALLAATDPTWYVRTGDLVGPASALLLVLLIALGGRHGTGFPGSTGGIQLERPGESSGHGQSRQEKKG